MKCCVQFLIQFIGDGWDIVPPRARLTGCPKKLTAVGRKFQNYKKSKMTFYSKILSTDLFTYFGHKMYLTVVNFSRTQCRTIYFFVYSL